MSSPVATIEFTFRSGAVRTVSFAVLDPASDAAKDAAKQLFEKFHEIGTLALFDAASGDAVYINTDDVSFAKMVA